MREKSRRTCIKCEIELHVITRLEKPMCLISGICCPKCGSQAIQRVHNIDTGSGYVWKNSEYFPKTGGTKEFSREIKQPNLSKEGE